VLDTADDMLECNTRKLKLKYTSEFQFAAETGRAKHVIFTFSLCLRSLLFPDTQANEGVNNLLKGISTRCRNIGLPLLSSRTSIKKAMGVGSRDSCGKKWSVIRDSASALVVSIFKYRTHGPLGSTPSDTMPPCRVPRAIAHRTRPMAHATSHDQCAMS
jgi:hypothetical protein